MKPKFTTVKELADKLLAEYPPNMPICGYDHGEYAEEITLEKLKVSTDKHRMVNPFDAGFNDADDVVECLFIAFDRY